MMGQSHWYYFLTGVMGFVAKVWVPQKSLFSLFLHAVGISRLQLHRTMYLINTKVLARLELENPQLLSTACWNRLP